MRTFNRQSVKSFVAIVVVTILAAKRLKLSNLAALALW